MTNKPLASLVAILSIACKYWKRRCFDERDVCLEGLLVAKRIVLLLSRDGGLASEPGYCFWIQKFPDRKLLPNWSTAEPEELN